MERIFSGYIKAHGYAIAVAALTFGCIFAADVSLVEEELRLDGVDDVVVGELFLVDARPWLRIFLYQQVVSRF